MMMIMNRSCTHELLSSLSSLSIGYFSRPLLRQVQISSYSTSFFLKKNNNFNYHYNYNRSYSNNHGPSLQLLKCLTLQYHPSINIRCFSTTNLISSSSDTPPSILESAFLLNYLQSSVFDTTGELDQDQRDSEKKQAAWNTAIATSVQTFIQYPNSSKTFTQGLTSLGNLNNSHSNDNNSSDNSDNSHNSRKPRVVVAVSGGIDSSVSLYLLKRKGFDVIGVYMKNWDEIDETGHCTGEQDMRDAALVCKAFGVPFKMVNFVKEYWNEVFLQFIEDYKKGLTPNPDIMCNKEIKFKCFFHYATQALGADYVATGHYAQVRRRRRRRKERSEEERSLTNSNSESNESNELLNKSSKESGSNHHQLNPSKAHLLTATDPTKDQTYFLAAVTEESLNHVLFPVGGLLKSQVKQIATEIGLNELVAKKESTGICFVGKRNFSDFISEYIPPQPGPIETLDGKTIGTHKGHFLFTIGQSRLLPPPFKLTVVAKIASRNAVIVTQRPEQVGKALQQEVSKFENPTQYNASGAIASSDSEFVSQAQTLYNSYPGIFVQYFTVDVPNWISGTAPKELETVSHRVPESVYIKCDPSHIWNTSNSETGAHTWSGLVKYRYRARYFSCQVQMIECYHLKVRSK